MELTANVVTKVNIDPIEVISKLIGPYYIDENGNLCKYCFNEHEHIELANLPKDKDQYYKSLCYIHDYLKSNNHG